MVQYLTQAFAAWQGVACESSAPIAAAHSKVRLAGTHGDTVIKLHSLPRGAPRPPQAEAEPSWDYRKEGFLPTVLSAVLMPAPPERRIKGKPVAVLIDEGCFSSCDIFAGAIRLAPGVTLIGTTTARGSGRSRDFVLPNSRLRVTLSTMASFQPNGELYDGIGIRPTVVVERSIGDLGTGRDTQKEAARRFLRR